VPTAEVPIISPTTSAPIPTAAASHAPAWTGLGLTGRLVFSLGNQGIQQLDLATGELRQLFTVPQDGWLTAASLSPADRGLALAYAPPPEAGAVQLGYTGIYLLPAGCAARATGCAAEDLMPLVERQDPFEAYFSPVWSPSGQTLYVAHFTPSRSDTNTSFKYTLERLAMTGGTPAGALEKVLDDALWPAVSPDGARIAYVYSDPDDFSNHLYVAGADGSHPVALTTSQMFEAVDAPMFSDDGSRIIFSAVGEGPTARGLPRHAWIAWLTGAGAAAAAPLAHNVPSDWWEIPAAGGQPSRLTRIYEVGLFGDLSPDGRHLAYLSSSGLYVMGRDGSNVQRLLSVVGYGTLEWVAE
jgi:hypothetical protein